MIPMALFPSHKGAMTLSACPMTCLMSSSIISSFSIYRQEVISFRALSMELSGSFRPFKWVSSCTFPSKLVPKVPCNSPGLFVSSQIPSRSNPNLFFPSSTADFQSSFSAEQFESKVETSCRSVSFSLKILSFSSLSFKAFSALFFSVMSENMPVAN